MPLRFRFLSCDSDADSVPSWLEARGGTRQPSDLKNTIALSFPAFGPVVFLPSAVSGPPQVDTSVTPIVTVAAPRLVRSVIWTAGEVAFLPTPLRRNCPGLHRLSKQFLAWLSEYPRAHSHPGPDEPVYPYFLRGELLNFDSPIFVFPSAMAALRSRTFFVSSHVGAAYINTLCRELQHQGVLCSPPEA